MKNPPVLNIDNKAVYTKIAQGKNIVCSQKDTCDKYNLYPNDCKDRYCGLCDKSPRQILQKRESEIGQWYDKYEKVAPDFKRINIDPTDWEREAELLRSTFKDSEEFGKTKKKIFDSFKKNYRDRCPFCMMSPQNTLDHYLCKSGYPQFILYSFNLVPCCGECNTLKGKKLFDSDNNRMFLHYYYDEEPEEPILECSIFLENDKPSLVYDVNDGAAGENADIYRRQFRELHLGKKYQDACNGNLSTTLEELKEYYRQEGIDKCGELLQIRLTAIEKKKGVNHYESAMIRGLLKDVRLLEVILSTI